MTFICCWILLFEWSRRMNSFYLFFQCLLVGLDLYLHFNSAVWCLHCVDMDGVADVLEVQTTFIFRGRVCRVGGFHKRSVSLLFTTFWSSVYCMCWGTPPTFLLKISLYVYIYMCVYIHTHTKWPTLHTLTLKVEAVCTSEILKTLLVAT
jgi:hypothetical protein